MADFDDIKAKLKRHKLIPTIPNILKASQELGCWELTAEVESIWSTYQQFTGDSVTESIESLKSSLSK